MFADPVFVGLSALRDAPTMEQVERIAGARGAVQPRQDRHDQIRLPDGADYIRVAPAEGRPRVDTGTMAAFISPVITGDGCLSLVEATRGLEGEGWTSPPPLTAERHAPGGAAVQPSGAFTRHDRTMTLYLFRGGASEGCVVRYALLWRMELAGLATLAPWVLR